jgi:Ca2+:H+ antiporter
MQKVFRSNHIYTLLIFIPFGIVSGAIGINPTVVFILNMLAIIPLAMLLSFATEELSENAGQTIGALLNATFGNAVEMIVSYYHASTLPEKLHTDSR